MRLTAGLCADESYPQRPVRIIVPFGTGGTLSVLALTMANELSAKWGSQPVIDARPGAGGNLGAEEASRASADGYTLLFTTQSFAANATLEPNPNFDPVKSFDPVVLVGIGQNVLVVPASSPFASLGDLVDAAKAHPGALSAASLGTGSTSYLATEDFKSVARIEVLLVPYNSAASASVDVLAGRIGFWITTLGSVLPSIRNGGLRALAITGERRSPTLGDAPTFAEAGYPNMRANAWFALFAPKGTPERIASRINRDVNEVLALPGVRERFAALSIEPAGGSRDALAVLLRDEIQTWRELFGARP